LNLNASEMTIQGDEGLQLSTPEHTIELNEFASTLSPKIELQASTRRAHPKIILPGSPEAMYLQFGGIAMKQDTGIKNAQAQSETAMGVYKETWNGLCGLATGVGDLVGTGADIAFGDATWEGSRKDLYQRNHLLQYAVERGREQQEYIESVRSGERSYGQVAFDALQKSMEIQLAPAIDTIESIKTIVKGSGTINPYASTLEQNQEFGRRSGEASQELLLVASNFIGVGRAAKPAASAAKKLSKAEKALQGSHHEESGGGKGIGALLGGKDAAKAAGVGQGGVKTGATAVLLMARSAFSRAGSKGSRLLAGLMCKALVKAEPFKIQRRELVPDKGHGHTRDQGYRYHDKEDHSSSHERKQQKKNLEEGMYSGRRPEKEPDRKHDQDKSKESAPMSSNKPDKVPEKNNELDTEAGSTEGTGKFDPLSNPKIAKEIESNSDTVYGYSPKKGSPLDKFGVDWTNQEQVASARAKRMEYLKNMEQKKVKLESEVAKLQSEGKSIEEIARKMSEKRNLDRMKSYDSSNSEGLAAMKERNIQQYGREEGPTPEQLFEKYGSWEEVIYGSVRTSPAMDVLTGLYKE